MTNSTYPQTPDEWQSAILDGIGISKSQGQKAYREGEFPFSQLAHWVPETFSKGFSPDFVPALLRNIQGLVAWVYGGGEEPYWPGADNVTMNE